MRKRGGRGRKGCSFVRARSIRANKGNAEIMSPARRLVLIDIENYCGKGVLSAEDVRWAKESIANGFALSEKDLVVIGTSHGLNCLVSAIEWPGPRQVMARGHDGADIALIEAFHDYRLNTFGAVMLISGDGIFTDIAKVAELSNTSFTVVARRSSLSRRLAMVASIVRYAQSDNRPAA